MMFNVLGSIERPAKALKAGLLVVSFLMLMLVWGMISGCATTQPSAASGEPASSVAESAESATKDAPVYSNPVDITVEPAEDDTEEK